MKETHKYDDIIHLSRPVSGKRSPMTLHDRAAQFSPFAALTGYDAVIEETARLTDRQIELDEGGKALLDEKLRFLRQHLDRRPPGKAAGFSPGRPEGRGRIRDRQRLPQGHGRQPELPDF